MTDQELFAIVDPWFQTGSLSVADKPAIQAFYTELTGDIGERCRTCPNYWNDVQHTLRVYLKQNGFQSMDNSSQEYIIREDLGYLQLHGVSHAYINKGSGRESDSAKYLTDPIAKALLADRPHLSEVIIKNPDYAGSKAAKSSTVTAKAPKASGKPKTAKTKTVAASETPATPTAPPEEPQPNDITGSTETNQETPASN